MKAIADSGFLLALLDRRDAHHAWAQSVAPTLTKPLLTCEAVLIETSFHLRDAQAAVNLIRQGFVSVAFSLSDQIHHIGLLAERYADRHPDLADLCLIRLSELYPKHRVVTTDVADFRVYRRGRREAIPLLVPPALT